MTEEPVPADAEILDALRAGLVKLLPAAELAQVDLDSLGAATPLLSLPVDSVVLLGLMNHLEERFQVFIPEDDAFGFRVIGDVSAFIRQRVADKARRRAQGPAG